MASVPGSGEHPPAPFTVSELTKDAAFNCDSRDDGSGQAYLRFTVCKTDSELEKAMQKLRQLKQ